MITLHFTVSNYSEDFIELALCAEDKMLTSQQVTKYAWEKNEDNLQDYWKFKLITEVKKDIEGWEPKYELPWVSLYYLISFSPLKSSLRTP